MFGQGRPQFNPGAGMPGGYGITGSPATGWVFNKTAESGVAETIATFKVSDDAVGKLEIKNADSTNAVYVPFINAVGPSTRVGLMTYANITTDTGSNPAFYQNTRLASGGAVTVRPLWGLFNNDTQVLSAVPLNSGANLGLSWGTQAVGAPAYTTRSNGTRAILYSQISGSTADYALGVESGYVWISSPTAGGTSSGVKLYGGTGATHVFRADGYTESSGVVRSTGSNVTTSGAGVEMSYGSIASSGRVMAYDRTGTAFKDMYIEGARVLLRLSGTNLVTLDSNALTSELPIGLKSYTLATLPVATTKGRAIYVTDLTGGEEGCTSDGTNWRRFSDRSIAS